MITVFCNKRKNVRFLWYGDRSVDRSFATIVFFFWFFFSVIIITTCWFLIRDILSIWMFRYVYLFFFLFVCLFVCLRRWFDRSVFCDNDKSCRSFAIVPFDWFTRSIDAFDWIVTTKSIRQIFFFFTRRWSLIRDVSIETRRLLFRGKQAFTIWRE
jgi:hypothetical protein